MAIRFLADIIFELKYVTSKLNIYCLNKIVKFIYKKQDCILFSQNLFQQVSKIKYQFK